MSCRPRFAMWSGNQNATRAPLLLSRVTTKGTKSASVDDDLTVCVEGGPYDPFLDALIRARQRLACQPCRAVDESATARAMSQAKPGDHVA